MEKEEALIVTMLLVVQQGIRLPIRIRASKEMGIPENFVSSLPAPHSSALLAPIFSKLAFERVCVRVRVFFSLARSRFFALLSVVLLVFGAGNLQLPFSCWFLFLSLAPQPLDHPAHCFSYSSSYFALASDFLPSFFYFFFLGILIFGTL